MSDFIQQLALLGGSIPLSLDHPLLFLDDLFLINHQILQSNNPVPPIRQRLLELAMLLVQNDMVVTLIGGGVMASSFMF